MSFIRALAAAATAAALVLSSAGAAHAGLLDRVSSLIGGDKTMTVAVVGESDFVPDRTGAGGTRLALPDELVDRVIEHLTRSKRFTVVERDALRRAVTEQRFGASLRESYMDRTLDKAIGDMDQVEGLTVAATGFLADRNDLLKDFQDLGSSVKADYLILGNLEKLEAGRQTTAIPYSGGRQVARDVADARVRVRVVEVATGKIIGAASLRTRVEEWVFAGKTSTADSRSVFDHVARETAVKIMDILHPATVASLDPTVISRGANDGVKAGDVFDVVREGKEIRDGGGAVLGRLRDKVATATVRDVQETFSVVNVAGGPVREGDLAVLAGPEADDMQAATAAAAPVGTASANGTLPRVAVGLIRSDSTGNGGETLDLFTDTLITRLVQTKRFSVADRQEVNQLLDEQVLEALAANRDLPSAVGSLKAVDYLLIGSVALFDIQETQVSLPGASTVLPGRTNARVEGNMRLVDSRSGDILASEKVVVNTAVKTGASDARILKDLSDAFAEQAALVLVNGIYPIKVAAVGGNGTVYLNRGADGGLVKGAEAVVYRPGQRIIDPDTGVVLGHEETRVATLVVNEVDTARAMAAVVAGDAPAVGDLVKVEVAKAGTASAGTSLAASSAPAPERTGGMLPGTTTAVAAGAPKRFTVAVGGLSVASGARLDMPAAQVSSRMIDQVSAKLAGANRFQVIERQNVDRVLQEKQFQTATQDGDIHSAVGQMLGADYLVVGEITAFYTASESRKIPYLDRVETTTTGTADGVIRVIDVATGAVVAADTLSLKTEVRDVSDGTKVLADLLDGFATDAVGSILQAIFPIKVMGEMPDGTVYVNRGSDGGLKAGDRFALMRPGDALRDPDTGMVFGAAEAQLGVVEIISVEPSRSRARADGMVASQAGDILRPLPRQTKPQPRPVSTPKW